MGDPQAMSRIYVRDKSTIGFSHPGIGPNCLRLDHPGGPRILITAQDPPDLTIDDAVELRDWLTDAIERANRLKKPYTRKKRKSRK